MARCEETRVELLEVSEEEETTEDDPTLVDLFQKPLSPRSSLKLIQRQEDVQKDFLQFLQASNQCNSDVKQGKSPIPPILRSGIVRNWEPSFKQSVSTNKVKITLDDIEEEIYFWQASIVCYVLGANPPLHVLEGFVNRAWKDKIDRVKMLSYGIFIIRFNSLKDRDQILEGGYIFFSRRPVIMKAWDPNGNFKKEDVKKVPILVQLEDLDLKYWEQRSLFKIVVRTDQQFLDMLEFENEHGNNTHVGIKYEWKPIVCNNCYGLGHLADDCKKNAKVEKKWVVKEDHRPKQVVDEDGFVKVTRGTKGKEQTRITEVIRVENTFQALDTELEHQVMAEKEDAGNEGNIGGEIPLSPMDKLLCWNVRGANNQQKQRLIKQFISHQKVYFIGLLETRVKAPKLGTLYANVFEGGVSHPILRGILEGRFLVTVIYASNKRLERKRLWRDIYELNTSQRWCLMGDFNEILAKEERIGLRVSSWPDGDFLQCVNCCNLEDIKSNGNFFAWTNKQHGEDRIFSKIDRVLSNQDIWSRQVNGSKMFLVVMKLKSLKTVLKDINRDDFSDLQGVVHEAKVRLEEIKLSCKVFLPMKIYRGMKRRLGRHMLRQRLRQNRTLSIEQQDRERVHNPQLVQDAFIDYYKQLLGTEMENRRGPDGYSSFFYQDNEDTIGELVSQVVISFLEYGKILKEINSTVITLAPKIATKMLCFRLKAILPSLIFSSQGGFIKGTFIGHTIMICQDLVRHYGRKANKPSCLIKLDLQKAYDIIEWEFIEEMLEGLQFPPKFVKLIMQCISTPRCSLMFNGTLHGFFETMWGLRQGDPISPLLFVMGMEYLSRLMGKIGEKEDFSFHDRCGELKLNHLAFADDVLLFCKGKTKSVMYMLQALKLFSTTSGLYPNANKTALYCSNMEGEDIDQILRASGFTRGVLPFTYLGIPINVKKISGADCEILAEKMTATIRSWSTRNLSFAARTVLTNSILIAIQAYWSQICILPKKLYRRIEAICRSFCGKA
uniref:Reverse transcriptase domain-containing protein n=1 Tax=Cannabis sativa TaxID=3483 RepID=A0A803QQC4_CANSA